MRPSSALRQTYPGLGRDRREPGDRVVLLSGSAAGSHGTIILRRGGCCRVQLDRGFEVSALNTQLATERVDPRVGAPAGAPRAPDGPES